MQALKQRAQRFFGRVSATDQVDRKHAAELEHWRSGLRNLENWFGGFEALRIGLLPPSEAQKVVVSNSLIVNAVMTVHALRPHYTERLQVERNRFTGRRVLEIGCGPLAPILQFHGCARHCIDPLIDVYMAAGWPLYDYDAKFINTGAESMPYCDGYFDSVISVNALDHVDNFEQVAHEMQRVVRRSGEILFEVEYHEPTVTEPLELNDERVMHAFSSSDLKVVKRRSGKDLYQALLRRFDLQPYSFPHFEAQFVTWHGIRR